MTGALVFVMQAGRVEQRRWSNKNLCGGREVGNGEEVRASGEEGEKSDLAQ